jgi:hypothetical protein
MKIKSIKTKHLKLLSEHREHETGYYDYSHGPSISVTFNNVFTYLGQGRHKVFNRDTKRTMDLFPSVIERIDYETPQPVIKEEQSKSWAEKLDEARKNIHSLIDYRARKEIEKIKNKQPMFRIKRCHQTLEERRRNKGVPDWVHMTIEERRRKFGLPY